MRFPQLEPQHDAVGHLSVSFHGASTGFKQQILKWQGYSLHAAKQFVQATSSEPPQQRVAATQEALLQRSWLLNLG